MPPVLGGVGFGLIDLLLGLGVGFGISGITGNRFCGLGRSGAIGLGVLGGRGTGFGRSGAIGLGMLGLFGCPGTMGISGIPLTGLPGLLGVLDGINLTPRFNIFKSLTVNLDYLPKQIFRNRISFNRPALPLCLQLDQIPVNRLPVSHKHK